jgi:hypothetical protein
MYVVLDTSDPVLDSLLNQSQRVQRIIVTPRLSGTARVDLNAIHSYGLLLA